MYLLHKSAVLTTLTDHLKKGIFSIPSIYIQWSFQASSTSLQAILYSNVFMNINLTILYSIYIGNIEQQSLKLANKNNGELFLHSLQRLPGTYLYVFGAKTCLFFRCCLQEESQKIRKVYLHFFFSIITLSSQPSQQRSQSGQED